MDQYLLFGAEIADGCLAEIKVDITTKRKVCNIKPKMV
jgi:hypothetical protein